MYTPIDWWFDYSVWLMLQFKFMTPAMMIARNDEMQKWLGHFSLNGIKSSNLCKPY
jgi:hypothetical protein